MAISLYDASVACFIQTLTGVSGFLDRGLAYCSENGIDPNEVVETRLYTDMFPFRFQIVSVVHHSWGAIEGVKAGVFGPPSDAREHDYAGLQGLVSEALANLKALSREEVDGLEGRDVTFQFRDFRMPFVAEGFLMSFSLPNLHFHATTAYDILRMKGAPIGKRDYTGPMRLKV
jgi:hypothetical protein